MNEIMENIKYLHDKKVPFAIKTDYTKEDAPKTFMPINGIKKGKFFGVNNPNSSTGFTVISTNFFRSMVKLGMVIIESSPACTTR